MFLVIISILFQPLRRKYYSQHQQNKNQLISISKCPEVFISNLNNTKNCCNKNLDEHWFLALALVNSLSGRYTLFQCDINYWNEYLN